MIDLDHFTFYYPQAAQPALRALKLHIAPGEWVLVAGASGAGKSTFLRTLNGLTPHFSGGQVSGHIRVAGRDPVALGPQQMSQWVGMVFQTPEAQAVLSRVEQEIAFGLEQAGLPPAAMRLRVEEVLTLLDLQEVRDRPLRQLSGGERQRVALASALALRPAVLVLDEPTSQLDPQAAETLLNALLRLNQDYGLTILLAEQRLERVLTYVDRLLYLEEGRVAADGPVRQVLPGLPHLPPVAVLGRALGWSPLPLTVKEAQQAAQQAGRLSHPPTPPAPTVETAPQPSDELPLLELRRVHFTYAGRPAVRGVQLTVRPGEVVALLGPNGAGKTTLLKLIMGLLKPDQGDILVQGRSIVGRPVAEISRQVGYLPQNPDDLLFAASVREELLTTLRNHHLNGTRQAAVTSLLTQLGLTTVAEHYPRDLAVGQRQRVALGAVVVVQPRLVLLDEPTRGLDYAAKEALATLWRAWREEGRGILLVTHDVELAAQTADRVVILHGGEQLAAGSARAVLPASPLFAPQMARLFPHQGWLTAAEAIAGWRAQTHQA